jgi:hypothetical protein
MPSQAAKAAAILVFTSGVEDYDMAVKLYEHIENHNEELSETLDKFPGVCVWHEVEQLEVADWWAEIQNLACNIDSAHAHFNNAAKE